jgi:hypothetical protein
VEDCRHYLCRLRLNDANVFVVWYSSDRDGFVRSDGGRLLARSAREALLADARSKDIQFADFDVIDYDFDRIRSWCNRPDAASVECSPFLNAWNFFDDLAGLHNGGDQPYIRLSRAAGGCYDRLFWGCNLSPVTPPGEHFEPVWQADELMMIQEVLLAGVELLESEISAANE